jgi:hypothetical protein
MTTKEILEMESTKGESTTLLLFREGIFLKAYEESAYLFYRFVKKYQVKSIYYKNIGRALLSLGFPSHHLEMLVSEAGLIWLNEPANGVYQLTSNTISFSEEAFSVFKNDYSSAPPMQPARRKSETNIITRLQQFSIETSTPMECLLFLHELKLSLNDQLLPIK